MIHHCIHFEDFRVCGRKLQKCSYFPNRCNSKQKIWPFCASHYVLSIQYLKNIAPGTPSLRVIYLNSSSDYAETLMKFLLTLREETPLTAEDIDTCMTIVSAHIKFLQAEKGVCYVNAKFGDNVGSMFREFKSHASVFSPGDIATLERVVQLATAHNNNRGSSQRGGRGRGYRGGQGYQGYDGGYSRGGYRGHGNRYNWNRGGFQSRGGNRPGGDSWTDPENTNT